MNLPKIDISAIPGLDTLTGMFGSVANLGQIPHASYSDDSLLIIMVYLYELIPDYYW